MTTNLTSFFLIVFFVFFSFSLSAQKKQYHAKRITTDSPVIDGRLNDPVWNKAEWASDFKQSKPNEGEEPSQKTSFKILYDNNNLYIGIRAWDSEPEKIVKRMSRRDGFEGDWVEVNIDSYFDKQTAFSFTASASGVKGDEMISGDGKNQDASWDPIWYLATTTDSKGWTAEMKIPFSQLRFGKKEQQIWGIQLRRKLFRKGEKSIWQFVSQDKAGWVQHFGELKGIEGIKPKRQIELVPYTVVKHERYEKEKDNPYMPGKESKLTLGLDGKIGITNDMTIDFTVNPDFGQVEADPSEVNLSAFESYFAEKRPFFIEGRNIMNFKFAGGSNLFYSRRIGRSPQHYPDTDENEFVDMPEKTKILGAFKLTGKTKKGLSVGVLESVTAKESAEIDNKGEKRKETVEPLTNYFVGRVQKDFRKGNTILGTMITSTHRDIDTKALQFLHKSAYTGGIDFTQYWKEKKYCFTLNTAFSHVQGEPEAILRTQKSSRRYFQRPDADYVSLDSNATSLSGHGGSLSFGLNGKSKLRYNLELAWRSPGFELNDIGYLKKSDGIRASFWAGYRITEPFAIFRSFNININNWHGWDFGGTNIWNGFNTNFYTEFKNQWGIGSGADYQTEGVSNDKLRGGPSMKTENGLGNWINIHSDNRKKINFYFGMFNYWGDEKNSRTKNYWSGIVYRPHNMIKISLSPSLNLFKSKLQYVAKKDFQNNTRYIFADIDQKTVSMTIRFDLSIMPELSVQYYGMPFVSVGKYTDFKYITNPKADEFADRFSIYNNKQITCNTDDNEYLIDENTDGSTDYKVNNPDFNFKQFRSNLVVRWEYTPGSVLYVVWSQGRTQSDNSRKFSLNEGMSNLFDVKPHNIFLMKFSYRFSM